MDFIRRLEVKLFMNYMDLCIETIVCSVEKSIRLTIFSNPQSRYQNAPVEELLDLISHFMRKDFPPPECPIIIPCGFFKNFLFAKTRWFVVRFRP